MLYMMVTNDKYELPLFVGSAQEIADKIHIKKNNVYQRINRVENGSNARGLFKLVKTDVNDIYETERGDFIGNNIRQAGTSKGSTATCTGRQSQNS